MSKIYAFIIIVPFIAILLFKCVSFYEYDTKQRYIKDLVDSAAYKVKITGVLTADEYTDLQARLNELGKFEDTGGSNKCIILKKGNYINGMLSNMIDYIPGGILKKGDAFLVYAKSSDVCNYSRIQNGGISNDDSQNIYYKAKSQCRIEYVR